MAKFIVGDDVYFFVRLEDAAGDNAGGIANTVPTARITEVGAVGAVLDLTGAGVWTEDVVSAVSLGGYWVKAKASLNYSDTAGKLVLSITYSGKTTHYEEWVHANSEKQIYDRIGAAGAGLTALGDTRIANLDATVSSRASSAEVLAIQNNTSTKFVVPTVMERPDSGDPDVAYRLELYLYDEAGNMEAPDSLPTITVVNQSGTSRAANLSAVSLIGTGHYRMTYTVSSAHAMEQLIFEASIVEGAVTRLSPAQTLIVDTTAVDFTAADRTALGALPTAAQNATAVWDRQTALNQGVGSFGRSLTGATQAASDAYDAAVATYARVPAKPFHHLTILVQNGTQHEDVTVRLLDATGDPITGVLFGAITANVIVEDGLGGTSNAPVTILSSDWSELGNGEYALSLVGNMPALGDGILEVTHAGRVETYPIRIVLTNLDNLNQVVGNTNTAIADLTEDVSELSEKVGPVVDSVTEDASARFEVLGNLVAANDETLDVSTAAGPQWVQFRLLDDDGQPIDNLAFGDTYAYLDNPDGTFPDVTVDASTWKEVNNGFGGWYRLNLEGFVGTAGARFLYVGKPDGEAQFRINVSSGADEAAGLVLDMARKAAAQQFDSVRQVYVDEPTSHWIQLRIVTSSTGSTHGNVYAGLISSARWITEGREYDLLPDLEDDVTWKNLDGAGLYAVKISSALVGAESAVLAINMGAFAQRLNIPVEVALSRGTDLTPVLDAVAEVQVGIIEIETALSIMGEQTTRMLELERENCVEDQWVYDPTTKDLLSSRLRSFDTKANKDAAQAAADAGDPDYTTGLLNTWTMTATWAAPHQMKTFGLALEP